MDEHPTSDEWFNTLSLPGLLRAGRAVYQKAIRDELREAGFDDLPRGGAFVIGAMGLKQVPLSKVVRGLGTSKQAVGHLVDLLVSRGYVVRDPDGTDRRRVSLVLTERGSTAAAVVRAAVERIDDALTVKVGEASVHEARAVLGALADLGRDADD